MNLFLFLGKLPSPESLDMKLQRTDSLPLWLIAVKFKKEKRSSFSFILIKTDKPKNPTGVAPDFAAHWNHQTIF